MKFHRLEENLGCSAKVFFTYQSILLEDNVCLIDFIFHNFPTLLLVTSLFNLLPLSY